MTGYRPERCVWDQCVAQQPGKPGCSLSVAQGAVFCRRPHIHFSPSLPSLPPRPIVLFPSPYNTPPPCHQFLPHLFCLNWLDTFTSPPKPLHAPKTVHSQVDQNGKGAGKTKPPRKVPGCPEHCASAATDSSRRHHLPGATIVSFTRGRKRRGFSLLPPSATF